MPKMVLQQFLFKQIMSASFLMLTMSVNHQKFTGYNKHSKKKTYLIPYSNNIRSCFYMFTVLYCIYKLI